MDMLCVKRVRTDRAAGYAAAAPDTFVRIIGKLRLCRKAFGIVAPHAAKRTALEKDRCADARPVVYRKTLDVKNIALHVGHLLFDAFGAFDKLILIQLSILLKYQFQPQMRTCRFS